MTNENSSSRWPNPADSNWTIEKKHKIKIINDNADYGTYLAKKYGVPVFINDPLIMKV